MANPLAPDTERSISRLLLDPGYFCIWTVGGLTAIVRWLQLLVFSVYTFEITGSPLLVSLIPVLWLSPLALFGPLVGVIADRVSRKRFLLLGLCMITGLSVAVGALATFGELTLAHIAITSFLSGLFWTTDMPVRRRFMGDLAGDSLSTAMSLDSATGNATRMAGPLLGGVMLQYFGMADVFILSTVLFSICIVLTMLAPTPSTSTTTSRPAFIGDLIAGIRYVAGDGHLRRLFAITIVFNLFGFPFTSMVPVLGRAELNLSALFVGLLSSMEGLGAFCGAIAVAMFARPRYFYAIYLGGTTAFLFLIGYLGVMTSVAGGPWHSFVIASITLMVMGMATACFAAMQSTLTYLGAPPELRSRVLGVLTLCIGTGPIGFFNVGWMAESFGVPMALVITAAEGLMALLLIWAFSKDHKAVPATNY